MTVVDSCCAHQVTHQSAQLSSSPMPKQPEWRIGAKWLLQRGSPSTFAEGSRCKHPSFPSVSMLHITWSRSCAVCERECVCRRVYMVTCWPTVLSVAVQPVPNPVIQAPVSRLRARSACANICATTTTKLCGSHINYVRSARGARLAPTHMMHIYSSTCSTC